MIRLVSEAFCHGNSSMVDFTKDELPSERFTPKWPFAIVAAYLVYLGAIIWFVWALFVTEKPSEHGLALSVLTIIVVIGPPTWFLIEYWCFVNQAWRSSEKGSQSHQVRTGSCA